MFFITVGSSVVLCSASVLKGKISGYCCSATVEGLRNDCLTTSSLLSQNYSFTFWDFTTKNLRLTSSAPILWAKHLILETNLSSWRSFYEASPSEEETFWNSLSGA